MTRTAPADLGFSTTNVGSPANLPTPGNPASPGGQAAERSRIGPLIAEVDRLAAQWYNCGLESIDIDHLQSVLSALHAQVRILHAARRMENPVFEIGVRPHEQSRDGARLAEECFSILNLIDRVLRSAQSVLDCGETEEELLLLRINELLAILKRHLAEEEMLLYRAVWQDIGGES